MQCNKMQNWFKNRIEDPETGVYGRYISDIDMRWSHMSTREGLQILKEAFAAYKPALDAVFSQHAKNGKAFLENGVKIYKEKTGIKTGDGGTWTDDDYQKPEFLHTYVRTKLFQRIPETMTMLQQMENTNALVTNPTGPLRILSVGCGPCFELFAMHKMLQKRLEKFEQDVTYVGVDTFGGWEPYVPERFKFHTGNFVLGPVAAPGDISIYDLEKKYGEFDIIILSYVNSSHTRISYQEFLDFVNVKENHTSIMLIERSPVPFSPDGKIPKVPRDKVIYLNQEYRPILNAKKVYDARFTLITNHPIPKVKTDGIEYMYKDVPYNQKKR